MSAAIFEESLVLPIDPERAFKLIGDPANGPKIDPMIRRYEPEDGVMREGGRNRIYGRVLGIPVRIVSITREWDPPRRMQLESIRPNRPVRMILIQTFESHPEGTLLTYRADITGPRLAAAAFRWFIARNFQRAKPRVLRLAREPSGAPE